MDTGQVVTLVIGSLFTILMGLAQVSLNSLGTRLAQMREDMKDDIKQLETEIKVMSRTYQEKSEVIASMQAQIAMNTQEIQRIRSELERIRRPGQ